MKRTNRTVIAVSLILICCGVLYGQDQLVTFTSQLQKTPTDNVLREKIIKLGATMKPAPTVPDEAIRYEGRAQYAFKSAKSEADYLVAAQEYEKAVAAAPWVSGYYSDLCTIYDKVGKPEDAKRNCGFYLVALTDPDQITDAKRRIAGLEFAIEKANSTAAKVDTAKQEFLETLTRMDGAVLVSPWEQIGNIAPAAERGGQKRWKAKFRGQDVAIGIEIQSRTGSILYVVNALGEVFSDFGHNDSNGTPPPVFKVESYNFVLPGWPAACWNGQRTVEGQNRTFSLDKSGKTSTLEWCSEAYVLRTR